MLLPKGGNAKLSDVSKTNNGHLGQTLSCYSQAKRRKIYHHNYIKKDFH